MELIDLNKYWKVEDNSKSRVLTGKSLGKEIREKSEIDRKFAASSPLRIIIPKDIFSITPSFLEEFFRNVVTSHGKDKVLQNVQFVGSYPIDGAFGEAVDRISQRQRNLAVF